MTDLHWRTRAACSTDTASLFFPTSFVSPEGQMAVAAAKAICAGCPVLAECRAEILDTEGGCHPSRRNGVVAGMTPHQRYNAQRTKASNTARVSTALCGTSGGYRRHLREGTASCAPCRAAQNSVNRAGRQRRTARDQAGLGAAA